MRVSGGDSTALQGGPGADSKRRRARCAQGASRPMLHDLLTSFLAAFAAITPSELLTKIWESL